MLASFNLIEILEIAVDGLLIQFNSVLAWINLIISASNEQNVGFDILDSCSSGPLVLCLGGHKLVKASSFLSHDLRY